MTIHYLHNGLVDLFTDKVFERLTQSVTQCVHEVESMLASSLLR